VQRGAEIVTRRSISVGGRSEDVPGDAANVDEESLVFVSFGLFVLSL
jgi:hypothetical protein